MESLRGHLLIASPAIHDPHFRQTVVLLAEHTQDGAMGVILNRVTEAMVGETIPDLAALTGAGASVHVGGPVGEEGITVLARFHEPERAALLVHEDVGFIAAGDEDPAALADAVDRARIFVGHAGWGPGQLEEELDEESWIVGQPELEDLFSADPTGLWAHVLRRMGGAYALVATMPADPSSN
ncbi:unannotated protein [freshwater metagenome]|uniref:Unannotated protein n=1 Tax=freshwater metagenome TaxID=449393 RepID=A0A6J7DE06_9ZZZZ|nr:hypothetical protein [Actinomycetota bacterium]